MPQSNDHILTTHVGSLIRPPELVAGRARPRERRAGSTTTPSRATPALDAVAAVVRRQAGCRHRTSPATANSVKTWTWAWYVRERLGGFEERPWGPRGSEREPSRPPATTAPPRLCRLRAADPAPTRAGARRASERGQWTCVGPITYVGQDAKSAAISTICPRRRRGRGRARGVPARRGPGERHADSPWTSITAPTKRFCSRWPTRSTRSTRRSSRRVWGPADRPRVPRDVRHDGPAATLEISGVGRLRIEALNHALRGLPTERTRYHVCWGSWNGPHMFDVPLKDIVDLMLRVNVGGLQL